MAWSPPCYIFDLTLSRAIKSSGAPVVFFSRLFSYTTLFRSAGAILGQFFVRGPRLAGLFIDPLAQHCRHDFGAGLQLGRRQNGLQPFPPLARDLMRAKVLDVGVGGMKVLLSGLN